MTQPAGKRRQRVTLMRKTRSVDADGNNKTVWTPIGSSIPAEVIGISGREAVIGRALQGIDSYQITIRYRAGITDADQLSYRPNGAPVPLTLNIRSAVDPHGRARELRILADTGSPEKTPG